MVHRPHARVVLAPGGRGLRLRPLRGTKLSAVATAIRNLGLDAQILRSDGCVSTSADLLDRQDEDVLKLSLDESVDALAASANQRARRHRAALAAVTSLRAEGAAQQAIGDYARTDVLDPHQVEAVAAIAHPDVRGICLFDEQGLGKTVSTLFAFDLMRSRGQVDTLLVVAPKSMVLEWRSDAQRFFGRRYRVACVLGSAIEKRKALKDLDIDIAVTNFETLASHTVLLRRLLERGSAGSLLAVDESFIVKNPDALKSRRLAELRRSASRCVVLCGTPAPNAPQDLVAQFDVADGGETFRGVVVPKDGGRDVIRGAIETRGVYLRRLKGDVMNLPGRTFHRMMLPMEPQQAAVYRRVLADMVLELESVDGAEFRRRITSFMAQRAALLQICSDPSAVVDGYAGTPAKLAAMDGILEELIETRREKVVVWSFYRAGIERLCDRYRQYGVVRIDGGVTDPDARRDAVRRFQEDEETRLFVGNPAAAGAGITLHRARYAVYESFSNQAAHYLQSLDRIHRRGQNRPVEYIVLLCDGTLEPAEYERLLRKRRAAQDLLGDAVEQDVTRDALLAEARLAMDILDQGKDA